MVEAHLSQVNAVELQYRLVDCANHYSKSIISCSAATIGYYFESQSSHYCFKVKFQQGLPTEPGANYHIFPQSLQVVIFVSV